MKLINYIIYSCSIFIITSLGLYFLGDNTYAAPPNFGDHVESYLMGKKGNNKNETLRDLGRIGINKEKSLKDNIKDIFYPDVSGQGGRLWDIIKILGMVTLIVMLVVQGIQYAMNADNEGEIGKYHINFAYIILGGLIFFSATWILGSGLKIGADGGSTALMNNIDQSIMFQIFSGLRAGAFFIAIILLIYTGRKMMSAMDNSDKFKAGKQGILNIIIPLVMIKIIDYIYFIAQTPNLKGRITEIIVEITKVLGYVLGAFFIIMLIYYGFRLMFGGSNEHMKRVKNIIVAVFLGSLVIFIFFLIIYQIAQEFAG